MKINPIYALLFKPWLSYILLGLFGLLIVGGEFGFLMVAKQYLDQAVWEKGAEIFILYSLGLAGIYFGVQLMRSLLNNLENNFSQKLTGLLQDRFVETTLQADPHQIAKVTKGELNQRIMNDCGEVAMTAAYFLISLFRDPLRICVFMVTLFYLCSAAGLFVLGIGLLSLICSKPMKKKIVKKFDRYVVQETSLYQTLEYFIHHLPFIKVNRLQGSILSRWKKGTWQLRKVYKEYLGIMVQYDLVLLALVVLGMGIFFFGVWQGWSFWVQKPSEIVVIAGAVYFGLNGLTQLTASFNSLFEEKVRLDHLKEIFAMKPVQKKRNRVPEEFLTEPNIQIENLSFSYEKEHFLLSDLNLEINKGDFIWLCGENGAGKTTLAQILFSLLKPIQGQIWINQVSLSEVTLSSYWKESVLLFQEPMIFEGSLMENFNFDSSFQTDPILESLAFCGLQKLASSENELHDVLLGPNKRSLSFGEKQRLAFARTLLKNPTFLVADEALSGVDPESEKKLLSRLQAFRRDKITLWIAHKVQDETLFNKKVRLRNGNLVLEYAHAEQTV